jgi:hypothetical protein
MRVARALPYALAKTRLLSHILYLTLRYVPESKYSEKIRDEYRISPSATIYVRQSRNIRAYIGYLVRTATLHNPGAVAHQVMIDHLDGQPLVQLYRYLCQVIGSTGLS